MCHYRRLDGHPFGGIVLSVAVFILIMNVSRDELPTHTNTKNFQPCLEPPTSAPVHACPLGSPSASPSVAAASTTGSRSIALSEPIF